MYDSSDLHDFDADLGRAKRNARASTVQKEAQQVKDEGEYWRLFNSGQTYRDVTYGYGYATRSKPVGRVVSMTADAEKISRHEARFGAKDKPRSRRRSTPNLKGQVIELHSRGVVPAAIADTLNIADRRVTQILRSAAS